MQAAKGRRGSTCREQKRMREEAEAIRAQAQADLESKASI